MISNVNINVGLANGAKKANESENSSGALKISEKNVSLQDCYIMKKTRLIRVKTPEEVKFLESQFAKDPEWTRKTVQYCKEVLNLGTTQIYKWGFDKKLSLERRMKKLLKKNNKNKPRRRKGVKRSRKSCNSKNPLRTKQRKIEEADGLEDPCLPKLAVSRIDYNLEVARLISDITIYENSDKICRPGISDKIVKKKEQSNSLATNTTMGCEKTQVTTQASHKASSNGGASNLPDSWLDKIWDESFDADQYLSSTSDIFQETPFLMESDFVKKSPQLMKTASIPKALIDENDCCFKDMFRLS
ncbi:unnamed protein product [Moneuplotes crassus]|uniref:Homeobox domain-containing protein n=1 Tax=Euplotes crassus TaxID=5936 RepID=A0AAD1UAN7_EUPCR|nr:unnamed protein product [Moneuplotes crassus]